MTKKTWDPVNVGVAVLAGIGAIAVIAAAVAGIVWSVEANTIRAWAPTVSAGIATAALLLTAFTYNRTTVRQREVLTLEAWSAWQADTRSLRRQLEEGRTHDSDAMRLEDARSLTQVKFRTVASAGDDEERAKIKRVHDISTVLNGLERLAAGTSAGMYDRELLETLGRTIILKSYIRYEPFISAVRTCEPKPQPKAYVELETLYRWMSSRH